MRTRRQPQQFDYVMEDAGETSKPAWQRAGYRPALHMAQRVSSHLPAVEATGDGETSGGHKKSRPARE
jgi:hypothetical protein